MTSKRDSNYEIIGIGGPILDQLLRIDEAYLSKISGEKGGMEPIDFSTLEKIISESGSTPITVPGGSSRNMLHGLSRFGEKCAFIGMVGCDERGKVYQTLLNEQGITPLLLMSQTPTAIVLSLITPDGQRTMRTFQGASIEIRGKHLIAEQFKGVKLVHLEGYTLFNDDLTEAAMRLAHEAGAKISFDLSSFEIVRAFKDEIFHLLENYVDIIFCNETEAYQLTGEDESRACDFLADRCEIAVVSMGPKGCWVKHAKQKKRYPAYPVEPLDTTGAGDLFASGFLHGYMRGYPIEVCAHYGAIAGRAVVQVIGPIVPHDVWPEIYLKLKQELR